MRYVRYAALLVGPALSLLIYTGVLDLSGAIWLGLVLEAGFWLAVAVTVRQVVRQVRRERAAGLEGGDVLQRSLAALLPGPAAALVHAELRTYLRLVRWVTRKAPLRRGAGSH